MSSKNEFRARWSSQQIAELNALIEKSSRARNLSSFPPSPFGLTAAGQQDFRGFVLRSPAQYMRIQSIDLSQGLTELRGALIQSEFWHCNLEGIALKGQFVTRTFQHCSFRSAALQDARPGSDFQHCDFSGAKMTRAMARGARFVACDFTATDMRGVHLLSCVFENCRFDGAKFKDGSFSGSKFIGPLDPSQLAGNILDGATFS